MITTNLQKECLTAFFNKKITTPLFVTCIYLTDGDSIWDAFFPSFHTQRDMNCFLILLSHTFQFLSSIDYQPKLIERQLAPSKTVEVVKI